MQLCDVWDLSLLSQGHQIDEEFKTTQPFFLCEWLLILLSSVSGLTLDDIPITAVKHWHMKNTKSTFDEIVLFKNRCYKTFKYLEHACWLIRWLTVIQWKSSMCQNKSSVLPNCKNTSLVVMWRRWVGGQWTCRDNTSSVETLCGDTDSLGVIILTSLQFLKAFKLTY